ncbi:MAG: isocitrate lyase/phosphoenolpyruvate mutase family protein [Gemmatimonadales bacterium]
MRERLATGIVQVMATHSPLSARLAEEAGFDAVWASGFELSALYGVPDASLLSFSQHLEMTRAIAERVSIPVVADLDTGHGNALNVRHVVRQYDRAGAGAVVLEDKTFPKATSLLPGARHELIGTAEFQGKLAAALDARSSDRLLVIGRTEALIAGLGLEEALARGRAYAEAGADLILVHSKRPEPDEIVAFAERWDRPTPLAIVPTAYPSLDLTRIAELRTIRMVIYGNHAIRASVAAMRDAFATIRADGGLARADRTVAPLEEILRLQGMDEHRAAERRYLTDQGEP